MNGDLFMLATLVAFSILLTFSSGFRKSVWLALGKSRLLLTVVGVIVCFSTALLGVNQTLSLIPVAIDYALRFAMTILMMFVQLAAMMYFMSRARTYKIMPGEGKYRFKDYRGNPEVLKRAQEVVRILVAAKDPELRATGVTPIRGLLLEGDTGSGKTFLGQCIATEANVPFYYLSAPSLAQAFVGMSAMSVWRIYNEAGKHSPSIIFIDEIDAVGQKRGDGKGGPMMGMMGGMMGGGNQIINELLTQMDPIEAPRSIWFRIKNMLRSWFGLPKLEATRPVILTIGSTNLAATLDTALTREGRFDRKVSVGYPDADGRRDIIQYYLGRVKHQVTPEQVERLVRRTSHYSPVRLKTLINEGLITAISEGRRSATIQDVLLAQNIMEFGLPQPIRSMSPEERRRIAWHEAGHGVFSVLMRKTMRVEIATIVRRGGALGLVGSKQDQERYTSTKEDLFESIDSALASRAVEELYLSTQMSGFRGDLKQATLMAVQLIASFGMGRRLISYEALGMTNNPQVINEAATLIELRYRLVKEFIRRNGAAVEALAEALLAHDDLDGPEVEELVRENAVFTPETLTAGLSEMLSADESEYLSNVFSEKLARASAAELVGAAPAAVPQLPAPHGDDDGLSGV